VDETRIITTEGLTTCLDPGRGWTITSGGWNFFKKQECWEGHEQALITIIRKETKRTEELEEALEIKIDLSIGFPINNIISLGGSWIQITNVGSITSTAADQ